MIRKRRYRTDDQYTNTDTRTGKKTARTQGRVELTMAKAEKVKEVASKRKWLVILIGMIMGIATFFKFKIGP